MTTTVYPAGAQVVTSITSPTTTYVDIDQGGAVVARAPVSALIASANAPIAAGASLTLTAAGGNKTVLLNQVAGSTVTLPAATGSGITFRFYVTVTLTSAADKILAASSSDNLIGNVTGQTGNAVKQFSAAHASGFHSLQMPFAGTQPSGGFEGDWFEVKDLAVNTWGVGGMYQAGVTPTTPFSTATT